jgi:hypothetical protein
MKGLVLIYRTSFCKTPNPHCVPSIVHLMPSHQVATTHPWPRFLYVYDSSTIWLVGPCWFPLPLFPDPDLVSPSSRSTWSAGHWKGRVVFAPGMVPEWGAQ